MTRVGGVNALSEFLGLGINRFLRLHPQKVGIRCESDRPIDRTERPTLVAVETLPSPRGVPVPVWWGCETELCVSDIESIGVGEVSNALEEI